MKLVNKNIWVCDNCGERTTDPKTFNQADREANACKEIERDNKQIRHQKYKRCLAMAQVLGHVCPITNRKAKWRDKWHKRWLGLAEKFKESGND